METILHIIKKIIPQSLFVKLTPFYHYTLVLLGNIIYRFPTRHINVVAVTGTKGKTSSTELIAHILRCAGYKVALSNTIHFVIGDKEERNMFKMSMPGRFFLPRFFRKALDQGCDWIVLEITSQGVLQFRHKFIELNALVFTNISPEHIESHGSFENYLEAKLKIADRLHASKKVQKVMVSNTDDQYGNMFIDRAGVYSEPFSLKDAEPYELYRSGFYLNFRNTKIHSYLSGLFNVYNVLGALAFASHIHVPLETLKQAIETFYGIRGRLELINPNDSFEVYVDYAHTPDSLEKVYQAFPGRRIIGILGNTGGGRDTWKRSVMAQIAEKYCYHVIFANEDPYDEDPEHIVEEMYNSMEDKAKAEIILDRREAINKALRIAQSGDVILITGKGTDPYIMMANNTKTPWDDATVVREELQKIKENNTYSN